MTALCQYLILSQYLILRGVNFMDLSQYLAFDIVSFAFTFSFQVRVCSFPLWAGTVCVCVCVFYVLLCVALTCSVFYHTLVFWYT